MIRSRYFSFMHRMVVLGLVLVFSAWGKTATDYFQNAASLYVEGRLPSANIEAQEGLAQYPADAKLQMLAKRIQEAQDEQKKECDKKNPGNQENQDDQDQKDQENQNDSQQSPQDSQNQGQSSSAEASSSAQNGASSDSHSQEDQPSDQQQQQPVPQDSLKEGQLSPDQAAQLLKDFEENDREKKRKLNLRGRAIPEKDW